MDSRVFNVLYNNVRLLMQDLGDEFGDDIGYVVEGYIRGYLDALQQEDCTKAQYKKMYDLIFSRVPLTYAYYPNGYVGNVRPPMPPGGRPPMGGQPPMGGHPGMPPMNGNPGEQPDIPPVDEPLTDNVELPVDDYVDTGMITDVVDTSEGVDMGIVDAGMGGDMDGE